eukprot:TRINITY_DN73798_c0_g1_i1.p1 TRINITY_DN73798_c0_g1~~TRINITY_DN73798_c0_g1_i1.p1  ORF type:complete len:473 (-),score=38.12 TRINITY_DN73798_c0_g1_i1:119-1492(-)
MPRFIYCSDCAANCGACGNTLFVGSLAEEGHSWNGKPASTFMPLRGSSFTCGDQFSISCVQGHCVVGNVCCSSCDTQVGWKFIQSAVESQKGTVGLMLPHVTVNETLCVLDRPHSPSDELDSLAYHFMSERGILGMTAAFCVDGCSPVQRGWGSANKEGLPLAAETRMRIASVSKPITAVAVLRLVEQGKIDLDASMLPLIEQRFGRSFQICDPRVANITVRHLLHHLCGGWSNSGLRCPMFMFHDLCHEQLIETIFCQDTLNTPPGTRFAYSNFGYCLLGRIVEGAIVDGRSYEDYVTQELFAPYGITCGSVDSINTPSTCSYYMSRQNGTDWVLSNACIRTQLVSRMDAHGGWVLSAPDLLRFSAALDSNLLLSQPMKDKMLTPCPESGNYGMGWNINSHARWHDGTIEGTGAIFVSTLCHGGMTWALLVNTGHGCPDLDKFAWSCVDAVKALSV